MDSKISAFPVASTLTATDLFPIVNSGVNKVVTAGVMFSNIPNIGNIGITKSLPATPVTLNIVLTSTLYKLPVNASPYVLPNGVEGQQVILTSITTNSITLNAFNMTSITFGTGSSVSLVFVSGAWMVTSSYNCTFV